MFMKYALFIGINQYTNGITPLKCARNDALALSKLFALNGYDVNILLDHEANATNIRKTLRTMGKQLKNDDVFFFYFSGHGCEVNKNHYLIGQAAYPDGIDEGEETVALNRVRELTDIPGVRRLFVLDCCRNDLHGGKGLEVCPESRDIALAKISNFQYEAAEIIHPLIVTSCSTGERAYEDIEEGRGYFTQVLEKSLLDKTISSFSTFRKALAEGMENIQKIMKQKQTLCWHGNVDSWDEFKLFDSWNGNMQNSFVSNSLQKDSVFTATPLSPEERMKFNDLIFSIEEICNSLHDFPQSDSMKKSLISIQERGKLLSEQEQNRKNFNKIQELHTETETLKKNFHFYKVCQKNAEKLNAGKDFLNQHGIALNPEIAILEKKALFAQNRNDFEVANNIYLSAEKIISKQKIELSLKLKNIADLKAQIKQTEEQLSCSSESIHANFGYIEPLQKAESLKDYTKMASVLSAILKHNREKIRLQSVVLDSISEIKSKIAEMDSFFEKEKMNLPAEAAGLRETAEKYYDLKDYIKSENCWNSALEILENKKQDYKSFQKAAAEFEILENEHFSKELTVPENIASVKNKVNELVSQKKYFDAELCMKEGIESLKKNLNVFYLEKLQKEEIKQLREAVEQLRIDLEKKENKIPDEYNLAFRKANQAHDELNYDDERKALNDAKNILKNLENSFLSKQQAEIESLKKEFEKKNQAWWGERGIIANAERLEKSKLGYGLDDSLTGPDKHEQLKDLWRKRLLVIDLEKSKLRLYWILFVPLFIISQIIVSNIDYDTAIVGVIIPPCVSLILITFSGFNVGSWLLSGVIFCITQGIVSYNTANHPSAFLALVIIICLAFLWWIAGFLSFLCFPIYKLVWKHKYGDIITYDSF